MKTWTKKSLDHALIIRIKNSDFESLKAIATRLEVSMSEVAREALRLRLRALKLKHGETPELRAS